MASKILGNSLASFLFAASLVGWIGLPSFTSVAAVKASPIFKPIKEAKTADAKPADASNKKNKKNKLSKKPGKTTKKTMVQLDFNDVEIKEVINTMSKITGKSFIYDEAVRGKITIISPKPVSIDDAYQVFLSALEMKGFTTVPKGKKFIKIVPLREIQSQAIPFSQN